MIVRPRSGAFARRARDAAADGERGSIAMVLLVVIVSMAFGGIIVASVISQTRNSSFVQSRVADLDAAQAGIDDILSRLRTATSTTDTTVGDSGRLPCGPFTNQAAGDDGKAQYTVRVAYYSVDPSTLGGNDLTDSTRGKLMICTNSAGPYNTVTGIRTPRYALITSTGTQGSGNGVSVGRTVQTTYNFQVLDQNISGGQIRIYPATSTSPAMCMDAGANPAVGTAVLLQPCSTSKPPIAQQMWAYRSDLSIELVESTTNPATAGLCIDTNQSPTAHASGNTIVLKRCGISDANVCNPAVAAAGGSSCSVSPWYQQWSVDDNAHLEGAQQSQSDIDGFCINTAAQAANTALTLSSCAGGTSDPAQTWIPAPTAGPGMAGAANQQLVNFQYFATCLDVTGQNVGATYMILYTCKQNPNPSKVAFNQRFIPSPSLGTGPTNTLITVVQSGVTYCLKSPGATAAANSPTTAYPVLVRQGTGAGQCPTSVSGATPGSGFVWKISQKYQADATTVLPYADRYTIKDADTLSTATPLCLGPGPANAGTPQYNTAVVARCDGTTAQKWNAEASLTGGNLTNTSELTPTAGN